MLTCNISGEPCRTPVVCQQTGLVFDKATLEKALDSNGGKCPHTGAQMSKSDVTPIHFQAASRPVTPVPLKTDVPSVLKHIQNEWDARSIEINQLRHDLHKTRQQLATALYRLDSAHRIIAKLKSSASNDGVEKHSIQAIDKEKRVSDDSQRKRRRIEQQNGNSLEERPDETTTKNELVSQVTTNQSVEKHGGNSEKHNEFIAHWPTDLLERVCKLGLDLVKERKGRVLSKSWASIDHLSQMTVKKRCLFNLKNCVVESTCVGLNENVFVGLSNGEVHEVDTDTMVSVGAGFGAHKDTRSAVRCLRWDEINTGRLITGGEDGLVRIWDIDRRSKLLEMSHDGRIVGIDRHVEGTVSLIGHEKGWIWRNSEDGDIVSKMPRRGSESTVRYGCSRIHPDGRMFAMGCDDGTVELWDVDNMKCVSRLGELTSGTMVESIAMSEKGYYMATCLRGVMYLWDLRKRAIVGEVSVGSSENGLKAVSLDGMGEYGCAVGGNQALIFSGRKKTKQISRVDLNDLGHATCIEWGSNAKQLFVGGGTTAGECALIQVGVI